MPATDCIFLVANSQYRYLLTGIARELCSRFGSRIHLYCSTKEEAVFWSSQNSDQIFSSITVNNVLYETACIPVQGTEAVLAQARNYEAWLGTTINELAMTDRHLGRGYALSGFYHPRSRRSENTKYIQMVAAYCALIEFWKREFESKRPTLMIDYSKVPAVIARKLCVPHRVLAGSRYKNFHQWAENEFFENSQIIHAYESATGATDAEINVPYNSHMTYRGKFTREKSFWRTLFASGKLLLRRAYWHLRGYEKAKGYFVWSEFRHVWHRRWDAQEIENISVPLSSLDGKTFIYYPLHTDPELSLQMLSPEYFYQHSCIAALSRDLPAGVTLAVKETFAAVGRRPKDFYKQISDFKNVVLLDMMELGLEVARKADAIATITGTGGFEAAALGKPVITFGRHNQYNFLPHVHVITNETTLKHDLLAALDPERDIETDKYNGNRFLEAILKVSFDLGGYDYVNHGNLDAKVVRLAVDALVNSLRDSTTGEPIHRQTA